MLDFSSLTQAHQQLKTSLDLAQKAQAKGETLFYTQFRAASIQAFEYCFEISIKFLRRFLREYESSEESPTELGFKDLVRLGAERRFIDEAEWWFDYRKSRNLTSHTYSEEVAQDVFEIIHRFEASMAHLIAAILKRS